MTTKSPMRTMNGTRTKSPTKGELMKQQLEQSLPLNRRLSLMRKDSKINDEEMQEYKRTELLRKSVNDVKTRARVEAERRQSPTKTYSNVKSKIAGNMKSQKKAKKMGSLVQEQQALDASVRAGNIEVLQTSYKLSPSKSTKKTQMSAEHLAEIQRKQDELDDLQREL